MEWGSDARREPCELVNLCSQDLSPGITTSLDASLRKLPYKFEK
jgi:hypothetical protein